MIFSSATVSGPQVTGPVVEGGCPRCGKRVYMAERQVAIGKVFLNTNITSEVNKEILNIK